ncbi:MAG TPA: 30S ribosomal protein S20 [Candidatus Paceibacterota bacterium]|nr:30S ribosomal protein S20 [Candidatus Paceibacterota bacterium]
MAITKGAKKAIRQSKRKATMNETRKRAVREALKTVRGVSKGDKSASVAALAAAYKAIDKAAKRGLIKKNTAARRKAKVAKALKA